MNVAEFYRTEPTGSQAYGAPRDGGKRTHTGDDYSHSTHPDTIDVPAIRPGRVTSIQRDSRTLGNGYGNQVTITHDDGSRFTYGHLGRITVALGEYVHAGRVLGTEGTTGWTDGPCVHVEYFTAKGTRTDPRPPIVAALATPTAIPNTSQEDDMLALRIKDNTGAQHLATLGIGVFRHLIQADDPERVKNIVRADDAWTDINLSELPIYLQTYGCDLHIWRLENGEFKVLDPRDGSVTSGGMWSAINARA